VPLNAFDSAQVITNLLPSLHAATRADLGPWADSELPWTEADLIQWMDEALKRLAGLVALFVSRDTSLRTVAGLSTYALPANHVATLHVSVDGVPLRPGNMAELEAREPTFRALAGTPDHWYEDLIGTATMDLTPVPTVAGKTLAIVYAGWPDALDVAKTQVLVAAPAPVKGYLALAVLKEAYGRESDMEMPDVSAHSKARMDLFEQIWISYYGVAS
jgi:hypothetical protein